MLGSTAGGVGGVGVGGVGVGAVGGAMGEVVVGAVPVVRQVSSEAGTKSSWVTEGGRFRVSRENERKRVIEMSKCNTCIIFWMDNE